MKILESGPSVGGIDHSTKSVPVPSLDVLLDAVAHGAAIGEEEATVLVGVDGSRLQELCAAAARLRDQGKGATVTFSPKVFIPLTRLCRDFCGYCTFRQDPEHPAQIARAGCSGSRQESKSRITISA